MGDVVDLFPQPEALQCLIEYDGVVHQFPITLLENILSGKVELEKVDPHMIKALIGNFIDLAYAGVFDDE